jgi:hypothetical protein
LAKYFSGVSHDLVMRICFDGALGHFRVAALDLGEKFFVFVNLSFQALP